MPVVLPIQGQKDIQFSATFREHAHHDLGMVANFINPIVSQNFNFSATFRQKSSADFSFSATFVRVTADFPFSATFRNTPGTASLPMSAHFYALSATKDLSISAVFRTPVNFPFSATFSQYGTKNILFLATFKQKSSLLMNATMRARSTADLKFNAFLGRFKKDLSMSAVFQDTAKTDFQATVTIQPYVPPHSVVFNGSADFHAAITVVQPTRVDLPFTATFIRHDTRSFPATIQVVNRYFGHGGVTVRLHGLDVAIDLVTQTTPDGYFVFNGLVPGMYEVTPSYQDMVFTPPYLDITLTDTNDTVYYYSDGVYVGQKLAAVPLPVNTGQCIIIPNVGDAGTLSIDGFILPIDGTFFGSILVTAHSAEDAAKFRYTLSRMLGHGV